MGRFRWTLMAAPRTFYAVRYVRESGRRRTLYMHRVILDAPPHLEVDHIHGNGLDNRRSRMRLCTHAQNNRNKPPPRPGVPRGVYLHKGKWHAYIKRGGRMRRVPGAFTSASEAAEARGKVLGDDPFVSR